MVRSLLVDVYALGLMSMIRVLWLSLYPVVCVLACFLVELGCGCFLQVGDYRLMVLSIC